MKFKFIFRFLFCLLQSLALSVFSQNNFAVVTYGTSNYFAREVFLGDTGETYFVGQCSIRGSINNERSWNGYCYTPISIMGGCSPSLGNTFVVGKSGLIRKNSACEIFGSWTMQTSGTLDSLYSIKFYDTNTGVTVGQNGTILRTTNNGNLWTPITSGTTSSLRNLLFKPDSSLVICGANGTVLHSLDSGLTWNALTTGSTALLADIDFPTNDTGYVVGRAGVMLKTIDGGLTWNAIATGTVLNLTALDFVSATSGVIVGDDGLVKRTTDGGVSWTTLAFLTSDDIVDVRFRNKLVGYMASTFDAFKTIDGGITWFNMGSDLESVKYVNDTTLIAVGDGIVRKSTDSGLNWNVTRPLSGIHWYDCAFPSNDTGYICGSGGKIMKTIDGGISYTAQVSNAPTSGGNYYFGMHFFDKNKGIAVGSQFMISRTNNGGQTWTTSFSSGASGGFYDVFFINDQVGWICGSGGSIRKTTNGGATFVSQTSGVTKFLLSIYFTTPLIGFACGESGTLLKTLDGGLTWTNSQLLSSSSLYSISFRDSMHGYISADSQFLFSTKNGGATWKSENNSFTMKHIDFRNSFIGYGVGGGDIRLYFDPIKVHNGYTNVCKGAVNSFSPRLVSGITISPGNSFIMEMDTTGSDFNDALFLGAFPDTASATYWSYYVPKSLKAGEYTVRVRTTATSPVNKTMLTAMTVYDDAKASIFIRNDTLFTSYNTKYTYRWRNGSFFIPGANQHYYVPTAAGTYTVYVQYGCCSDAIASITISSCLGGFMNAPTVDNNYFYGCDSTAFTLQVSGASNFRWYDSDTSTVVLDTTSIFTTPVLTTRDTFYVSAFNGTCESARIPIYTNFTSKPNPPVVLGDTVCVGASAYLFSPGNSYAHWFSDTVSTTELILGASYQIPSLLATDTFYVSNSNYNCESARIPVVAYAVNLPQTTLITGDTSVTIGDTVSYYYTAGQGNTVQWFVSGGMILASGDSLSVKWDSTTTARIGLIETNAYGCKSDTLWQLVEVDLAIGINPLVEQQFRISPNPAASKITVFRENSVQAEPIIIRDSGGKIVLRTNIAAGRSQINIDVSSFASGSYYVSSGKRPGKQSKLLISR
jgi:photosystem II stability/assembly factor-like uncharacterized protein